MDITFYRLLITNLNNTIYHYTIIHSAKNKNIGCKNTVLIFSCQAALACLTVEDSTDRLSWNVGKQLTTYAA
jgi:hypothetical protein